MTLDEKLRNASEQARTLVRDLEAPPLAPLRSRMRITITERGREMRNRPVLVAAGAVLAVVLVVGVTAVLQARSEDPVSDLPPTADDVTTPPSTTPPPQATLPNLNFQSGDLEPGTYVITYVEPFEITITVPEGWERASVPSTVWAGPDSAANLGFVAVDNVYANPCAAELGMLDPPVGPTVDDLVAALAALPGIETSAPRDVTVDGFAAKYIEVTDTSRAEQCGAEGAVLWAIPYFRDPMPVLSAFEHPLKVWIVDVDGERLVITSHDREETSPEQYAERDLIFESIQIDVP
jgi:hypothetical protein